MKIITEYSAVNSKLLNDLDTIFKYAVAEKTFCDK